MRETKGRQANNVLSESRHANAGDSVKRRTVSIAERKLLVAGLFAGIGGFEEGFRQAGHESGTLCEIDPLARHVLRKRFPNAVLKDDVTTLRSLPSCDVLVAGFPCQDLSQVGKTRGISGPNSSLISHVIQLLRRRRGRPAWVVLENVPFMLSLNGGEAIRHVTQMLEELGYAWAYRTINTQSFGLPQRRRRVILVASNDRDPRPVLLSPDSENPSRPSRKLHACGFYWTEGNTGLGWAVDAVPPLKGGSALHIPSPPAIWFPARRLIATPSVEDAERLQGFPPGWTDISDVDPKATRKRWRMIGNAVSVPVAKWVAERLATDSNAFNPTIDEELPDSGGWPAAGWGFEGARGRSDVSEWPVASRTPHLAAFLTNNVQPLSSKASAGFHSRLVRSSLRYEKAFRLDLEHHIRNVTQT
jgi:DNA (cytosine-5)-methyltransferase 1